MGESDTLTRRTFVMVGWMMDTIKRSSLANGLVNRLNDKRHPETGRSVLCAFLLSRTHGGQITNLPTLVSGCFCWQEAE